MVPCYYHTAPDPSALPGPDGVRRRPDRRADHAAGRGGTPRRAGPRRTRTRSSHVLMDRTVDTLLAHVRAVDGLNGLDARVRARGLVDDRVARARAVVPDVTVVLSADPVLLEHRARTRLDMPPCTTRPSSPPCSTGISTTPP
ncbi:hypothetical protein ACU686_26230 [Yinghuangia aomiensis]